MGAAAWAVPTPAPSGQQHVDFSNVSAAAAPPGPQLVANFHGQQQMHPQLLQQQQQQQQSHHSQPQLQQSFGLYDHYYNPGQEQYGFVPTSQPQLERQGYHPSQLGQLPGSTAVHYELAPPLSQPEQAAHYNQSFTSTDIPIFLKQERSPSSPAQQQASSTPPHPAAPAGPRHRERPSVDAISALPGQVEAATSVTMAKTKSPSATSMRKTGSASSPKAGLKRSREEADVGGDNEGSAEPEEQQKKRGRPRLEGGGESRGEVSSHRPIFMNVLLRPGSVVGSRSAMHRGRTGIGKTTALWSLRSRLRGSSAKRSTCLGILAVSWICYGRKASLKPALSLRSGSMTCAGSTLWARLTTMTAMPRASCRQMLVANGFVNQVTDGKHWVPSAAPRAITIARCQPVKADLQPKDRT